ncbi:hypothetical protein TWF679_000333 [Orbilia oligospora]|uniref:F-box domain-containing protein n=1 Tax=Orbilia oligospora TaxID=2813651 RepID=A0A8H8VHY7_ORBOL|nr:hypothetical protein TWF679_000333 [Orbilia oligospora]
MASSNSITLTTLPFEVLSEISSFLNNQSLKSLRLAAPKTKLSDAAFPTLFHSFSLRFKPPGYNLEQILLACDSLAAGEIHIEIDGCKISNPFSVTKRLVIDTSRPYRQSVRDASQFHLNSLTTQDNSRSVERTGEWLDMFQLKQYKELHGPEDYEIFNKVLERVLSTVRFLKHVRWRTSNTLGVSGHQEIAMILCRQASDGRFTLDMTLAIDDTEKRRKVALYSQIDARDHLNCLFGLRSLSLRMPKHHQIARPDLAKPLSELASRCKSSNIPTLERSGYIRLPKPSSSASLSPFWKSTDPPLETLELVALDLESNTDDRWNKFKSGTTLMIGINLWRYGINAYPRVYIFPFLQGSEIWVKRLKLDGYPPDLGEYLLARGTSFLTDIQINLKGQKKPNGASLGAEFWRDVVPMHSATLQSIRIFTDWQGAGWCFHGEPTNPAKLALEKCKELEELRISFIDRKKNYIKDLIDCVLESCPKFHLLEMEFCYGYRDNTRESNLENTVLELYWWRSTEQRFRNRVLDVRKKIVFEDLAFESRFQEKLSVIPRIVWFDYLLQTWRLGEDMSVKEGVVLKMNRMDDEYVYCDMLDDRSIEGPLKYMY